MSGIQTSVESADRLGAHRTVARRAVELPRMGLILWRDIDFGKIRMGKSARKTSGICTAYLYVCTCTDRLGIFLQSVAWGGYGLSRRDVRRGRSAWIDRQGVLFSADHWLLFLLCAIGSSLRGMNILRLLTGSYESRRIRQIAACVVYIGMFLVSLAFLVTESFHPFLYFRF